MPSFPPVRLSLIALLFTIILHVIEAQQVGPYCDHFNSDPTSGRCLTPFGDKGQCIDAQKCFHGITSFINGFNQPQFGVGSFGHPKVCCVIPAAAAGNFPPGGDRHQFMPIDPRGPFQRPQPTPEITNTKPQWSLKSDGSQRPGELSLIPSQREEEAIRGHPNLRLLPLTQECGEIPPDPYVIGGKDAVFGRYPWMALIGVTDTEDPTYKQLHCGGTLISERYVLTAAHCLDPKQLGSQYQATHVRLGEFDKSKEIDCDRNSEIKCAPKYQDIGIQQIVLHNGYVKSSTHNHDIALVRLKQPATLGHYVKPICLPISSKLTGLRLGKEITVAGWGWTQWSDDRKHHNSDILQEAKLPLASRQKCTEAYEKPFGLGVAGVEDERFCAGIGDKDACKGDSGGPAMVTLQYPDDRDRMYQVGIISLGLNCSQPGVPGLYGRVVSYIPWILDNMKP